MNKCEKIQIHVIITRVCVCPHLYVLELLSSDIEMESVVAILALNFHKKRIVHSLLLMLLLLLLLMFCYASIAFASRCSSSGGVDVGSGGRLSFERCECEDGLIVVDTRSDTLHEVVVHVDHSPVDNGRIVQGRWW